MNNQILAILIQEGSRLITESIKNRQPGSPRVTEDTLKQFIEDSDKRLAPYTGEPVPVVKPTDTLRINSPTPVQININQTQETPEEVAPGKAASIVSGCVPCALGHVGTCTGLLNESIRFAHTPEGMASPEVIDRVNMCLDELNAMERVDLRPEMLGQLSGWEKQLADQTLTESRTLRHKLEGLTNLPDLENVAATTQTVRKQIGQSWFKNKLSNMTPADKTEISKRVMDKINEMASAEAE